jgi:hypothetical protein
LPHDERLKLLDRGWGAAILYSDQWQAAALERLKASSVVRRHWSKVEKKCPGQSTFVQVLVKSALTECRAQWKTRSQKKDDAETLAAQARELAQELRRRHVDAKLTRYARDLRNLLIQTFHAPPPEVRSYPVHRALLDQAENLVLISPRYSWQLADVLEAFAADMERTARRNTRFVDQTGDDQGGEDRQIRTQKDPPDAGLEIFVRLLARGLTDHFGGPQRGWIRVFAQEAFGQKLNDDRVKAILKPRTW